MVVGFIFPKGEGRIVKKCTKKQMQKGTTLKDKLQGQIACQGQNLGKFLDLVESFKKYIPDEVRRYHAAVQAMNQAAGLSRDDILRAADNQINGLKQQREGFGKSMANKRAQLNEMKTGVQEIRGRMKELQEKLHIIETQEKKARATAIAFEKDIKVREESFHTVAQNLEDEITETKNRIIDHLSKDVGIVEITLEQKKVQEIKDRVFSPIPEGMEAEDTTEEEAAITVKPCPMCNSQMDFYDFDKAWKCYICGHEEHNE
jgi:chromosome segregation ATPase